MSADQSAVECETCGKTECPDAALPAFSEPRDCVYAPIYRALRDAKDCDYGCARDYTNQAIALWVVPAIERIIAAHVEAARREAVRSALAEVEGRLDAESLDAASECRTPTWDDARRIVRDLVRDWSPKAKACSTCGGFGIIQESHDGGTHPVHCPRGCEEPKAEAGGDAGLRERVEALAGGWEADPHADLTSRACAALLRSTLAPAADSEAGQTEGGEQDG